MKVKGSKSFCPARNLNLSTEVDGLTSAVFYTEGQKDHLRCSHMELTTVAGQGLEGYCELFS